MTGKVKDMWMEAGEPDYWTRDCERAENLAEKDFDQLGYWREDRFANQPNLRRVYRDAVRGFMDMAMENDNAED